VDLLFGSGSSSFILFGDGKGGALYVSSALSLATPEGFAADVDGNKTIDLVSSRLGSYFPANGHGGFGDPISLSFPQGSTLIAVADFNGAGKPDFVLRSLSLRPQQRIMQPRSVSWLHRDRFLIMRSPSSKAGIAASSWSFYISQ
jgi:hypothetical protein